MSGTTGAQQQLEAISRREDDEREQCIEALYFSMCNEMEKEIQFVLLGRMMEACRNRSQEQVRRMEMGNGH